MSRIIGTFLDAFNTALSTGLNYKLQHDQLEQQHGDSSDFIHLHASTLRGETYKPVFQVINEKYPDLLNGKTDEEKQCILNAIENAIDNGKIMLQNQGIGDFEVRMVSMKGTREITAGRSDVLINDYHGAFEKVRNFFKTSSSIAYLGGLIVIKNLSNDNGTPLDVSVCEMVSSTTDISNPESYDGEGTTTPVYNKDVYIRFFPSSTLTFYTKPITEIVSQYMTSDSWEQKKAEIFEKLKEVTGLDVDELKEGGSRVRCISGISQLNMEGIMNYDSLKQNSATFDQDSDLSYGPNVKLANTYIKFETPVESNVPYDITLYEIFLVGKSVNKNSDVKFTDDRQIYKIVPTNQEIISSSIESVLSDSPDPAVVEAELKAALAANGKIIVKNGVFVEPYKEGRKLKEGEEIRESKGEVFTLH